MVTKELPTPSSIFPLNESQGSMLNGMVLSLLSCNTTSVVVWFHHRKIRKEICVPHPQSNGLLLRFAILWYSIKAIELIFCIFSFFFLSHCYRDIGRPRKPSDAATRTTQETGQESPGPVPIDATDQGRAEKILPGFQASTWLSFKTRTHEKKNTIEKGKKDFTFLVRQE